MAGLKAAPTGPRAAAGNRAEAAGSGAAAIGRAGRTFDAPRYLVLTSSLRPKVCTPSMLMALPCEEHCIPAYFPVPEMQTEVL
jgi:hypothetical protein